jgi:hypothetical protein
MCPHTDKCAPAGRYIVWWVRPMEDNRVVELTSPKKLKLVETNLEIEAEVNECTLKRTTDKDYTAVRPHSLHSDP